MEIFCHDRADNRKLGVGRGCAEADAIGIRVNDKCIGIKVKGPLVIAIVEVAAEVKDQTPERIVKLSVSASPKSSRILHSKSGDAGIGLIDGAGGGEVSNKNISLGVNHEFDIAAYGNTEEVGVGDGRRRIYEKRRIQDIGIGGIGIPDGEGVREGRRF